MNDERRHGPRRRALLLAELGLPGARPVAGLVYDVGNDGICLLCDPPPEIARRVPTPARPVRVAVAAPPMDLRFSAWLVNRRGCRFGMKFGAMDDNVRTFLRNCMHARPADG